MYLQLDTKFNPFTYDEMVKPLLYYKQAYDEAESAYSDLSQNTEQWRKDVDKESSPIAYEMFQRYSGDLNRIVDDFSKGMNTRNRGALLGMKRRYAQDIVPIATASEKRRTLAEEQRKAELNNPTMLWQRKASDMSIDDFITNPDADYGKSYSGATLAAQVSASASALAKEFRNNPKKMESLVGGDYFEYIKQRGFSSEAVLAAILDNPNASPELREIVESTIDASGIKDWNNEEALNQAYAYARQGLWNAVGQDEAQLVQNWRAQENLSAAHAMERQKDSQKFQAEEAKKTREYYQKNPIPMKNKDGKITGYYRPDIGMVVDKDGNILSEHEGLQLTPKDYKPTEEQATAKPKTNIPITPRGNSEDDLLTMTKNSEIQRAGLKMTAVVVKRTKAGGYQYGAPGDDAGKGNRRLKLNKANTPILKDPNDPNELFETMRGHALFGPNTYSNVVSSWGNLMTDKTDNKAKMRYITDEKVKYLPLDAQWTIAQAAKDLGVPDGARYYVFAVAGQGKNHEDSYVIYSNDPNAK
jgi:hypothetical protein